MKLHCVKCGREAELKLGAIYEYACISCGFKYKIEGNKISYAHDILLYERFGRDFLLNAVLNNNSKVSYELFEKESVSVSGREDVARFRDFAAGHIEGGNVLDIGCGSGAIPEYLGFLKYREGFIGLDPAVKNGAEGILIKGAAEMLPLAADSVDSIVAATSLDHIVSLKVAAKECARVLKENGKMVIWMSDRSFERLNNRVSKITDTFKSRSAFTAKLKETVKRALAVVPGKKIMSKVFWKLLKKEFELPAIKNGWMGKYRVINGVPFYIPKGARDPFHSFNGSPQELESHFIKAGFKLKELKYLGRGEVFIAFEKKK